MDNTFTFHEGQEVKGVISKVSRDSLHLMLEGDEKAVIYLNDLEGINEGEDLKTLYNEGAEFTALIRQKVKDRATGAPLYILSTKLYKAREQLEHFEQLKNDEQIITGVIKKVNEHGADVYYQDFRMFLPIKNIDLSYQALKKMINEEVEVIVTYINPDRIAVFVSANFASYKKRLMAREEALSNIKVGNVVTGEVTNILAFGAIVSLGNISGLLHTSEWSHRQTKDISQFVKIGDTLSLMIIKFEDGKIGLSKKALEEHPWTILKNKFQVGDVIDGLVTKVIPAGLLIQVTEDYNGLMPRSEYSWLINDRLENKYKEGDTINVKIINIDDEKHRISLSHRATKENIWATTQLHKGQSINVTFLSAEEKGAKVSFGEIQGFMPISEVTSTRRISKADEIFKPGEQIDVIVLEFDPSRAKLIVSAKANETAKEREIFTRFFKEQAENIPTNTIGDALGSALDKFRNNKEK